MSEYPRDLPRLRTIERYLLLQLAGVRRAIERAENDIPDRPAPPAARWYVQWRFTPKGTPRTGVLHRGECFMADGDPLTAQQVQESRRAPGRKILFCEQCKPVLP